MLFQRPHLLVEMVKTAKRQKNIRSIQKDMVSNFQFLNKEDIEKPHSSTYKAVEGEVWPTSSSLKYPDSF